jgi:hypothetical protein
MDHNISHRKHFRLWKFRVACPDLRWNMPRRFTNDLEIAQHRINGFFVLLKIFECLPFGVSPNFGDALQDVSDA